MILKIVAPQAAVPTHIISGFLGAGKTTLLKAWLAQKPAGEVWAVLMNEFGQIGIDQALLPNQDGFAVQELTGGCLCCSSQLPMQLALSRLLKEHRPDRLFIEPTGLGHPEQLLQQLSAPEWQQSLNLRGLVSVVDGARLNDNEWVGQNLYQDQLKAAQVIVVSHADVMQAQDDDALEQLKKEYAAYQQLWLLSEDGKTDFQALDVAYGGSARKLQPLLSIQRQAAPNVVHKVQQLPYHYVESNAGYQVAGWKFPKRWQFDFYDLLDVLCEQQDWLRIEAIFNTNQGWKSFNFNPEQFNYQSAAECTDNRIEVIYQQSRDWFAFEAALNACRIDT